MRVCLINDSSVNPNWGCRATSQALKELIGKSDGEIVATVDLNRLLSFSLADRTSWHHWAQRLDPYVPRRPVVREVLSRTFEKFKHRLPDVVPETVGDFPNVAAAVVRGEVLSYANEMFSRSDAVIVNGEGGIYGFKREARLMYFLAYVAKVHFGLEVAIVNHTAELSDPRLRDMAAMVYPLLDDVVFREPVSARSCEELVPDGAAVDATFSLVPAEGEPWSALARRPGNLSVWPDNADFDAGEPFVAVGGSALLAASLDAEARISVRALLEGLRERMGQVVLTASDVPDESSFRPLAAELGLPLVGLHTPVQQAVDLLANATAYVGGRWHPSIFAVLGGTPFVPLATNTHKLVGLADLFDLPSPGYWFPLRRDQVDEIISLASEHANQGERLRERLRRRAEQLRPLARRNVALLTGERRMAAALRSSRAS